MAGTCGVLLEMRQITKRFPGVLANDHIDFDVRAGEVHTLFGENGAGKSTLMKILYGLHQPDAGEITIRGQPAVITSPAAAIAHGIGMIHQHFMLVPTLTVWQNVALGLKSSRGPLTDPDRVRARIGDLSGRYGLEIDPNAVVWQLSVGERQRVEIIKAVYRDVSLLVLDEPTAVLTPQEVRDLFRVLKEMVASGLGVVFISHKLNEVLELSDRITVLRGGTKVATVPAAGVSRRELATMMVGHDVAAVAAPAVDGGGDVRLLVEDLHVTGDRGTPAVRGLSFEARAGEIVAIAGVSGMASGTWLRQSPGCGRSAAAGSSSPAPTSPARSRP
jgi:simple sugar transport system ATP-binding protein